MKNTAKILLWGVVGSALLVIGCSRSDKRFLITDISVGNLTKETKISQLDSLYKNDSLVKTSIEGEFRYISDERFLVYEKGGEGKQLLELTPAIPFGGGKTNIFRGYKLWMSVLLQLSIFRSIVPLPISRRYIRTLILSN